MDLDTRTRSTAYHPHKTFIADTYVMPSGGRYVLSGFESNICFFSKGTAMILTFEGMRFGLAFAGGLMLLYGITVAAKATRRKPDQSGKRGTFLQALRNAFRFPGA